MNTLEKSLERFARGEISADDLIAEIKGYSGADAAERARLRESLSAAFQVQRIPSELYFLLVTELNRGASTTAANPVDDRTRLAEPLSTGAEAEDETRLAKFVSDDDRTLTGSMPDLRESRSTADLAGTVGVGARGWTADAERTSEEEPTATSAGTVAKPPSAAAASVASRPRGSDAVTEEGGWTSPEAEHRSAQDTRLGIGSVLKERFILEEVIGSGGMGVVYKALDLRKQEAKDKFPYVALKVLNEDFEQYSSSLIALQREAKKAQLLAHPNIITVYDFDRDHAHVFMSMEILDGESLEAFIKALPPGGMPFKKAWYIIKGLCLALAYAHKKGIVHSDFKPSNVFITRNNEVKVLDFGIACAVSRHGKGGDETVFNARDLGALTPAYASLEMFAGSEPDPRDDVYALGCVIYEILAGKHPFGKLTALKAQELGLQPKAIPGLSRRQWRGLQRALAFLRENRTPSVDQLMSDIQPQTSLSRGLGATILALLLGAGGYGYYVYQVRQVREAEKVIVLTPEQRQQVKDFLELAGIHFEVGYLTAPTGSNAAWAYRQALSIDPYNQEAVAGLKKIADIIADQAADLYVAGRVDEAVAKVEEGLEVVPAHERLLALKEEIMGQ